MKNRILVIGSASVDLALLMDKVPEAGKTETEKLYYYFPGGSATNAALMFSRFGLDTVICSRIAGDANGRFLTDFYRNNRIDTRFLASASKGFTGLGVILATESESNRYIIYNGVNDMLSSRDVEDALSCMPEAVFLQLSLPEQTLRTVLILCERRGIDVYCYTGHGKCTPLNMSFDCIRLLVCDERSCAEMANITDFKNTNLVSKCVGLADVFRADNFVIKLRSGSTLTYNNMLHFIYTPPCEVSPADPATAFDTFAAACTYQMIAGRGLDYAAKYAGLIEAMTLEGPGSAESCPRLKDIAQFASRHGISPEIYSQEQ